MLQCVTPKKRIPTNSIFTTVSRTITTTTNKLNEKCNQTSDASDTLLKKIGSCFKDFATCLPCFNNLLCFTNTINDTFYCINDLKNIIKKFLNLTDNTVDSCLNTLKNKCCFINYTIKKLSTKPRIVPTGSLINPMI